MKTFKKIKPKKDKERTGLEKPLVIYHKGLPFLNFIKRMRVLEKIIKNDKDMGKNFVFINLSNFGSSGMTG